MVGNRRFQSLDAPGGAPVQLLRQATFDLLGLSDFLIWLHIGERGADGIQQISTVRRRQKAIGKIIEAAGGNLSAVEYDIARKVFVFASQTVGGPCAHAGPPLQAQSAVQIVTGTGVLGEVGGHRSNDRQLVGQFGHMRKQITDPGPALSALFKLPGRLHYFADISELGSFDFTDSLARILAVVLGQKRLVVKRIHLGNAAFHEQENDALGACLEMWLHRRAVQAGQGQAAKTERRIPQEFAASEEGMVHFR